MTATATPAVATTDPEGSALTSRLFEQRAAQARYLDASASSRRLLTGRLFEQRAAQARLLRSRCFKPATAAHQSAWELAA